MTINDLKGELRELAIKRTKEILSKNGFEFDDTDMVCELSENFIFHQTPEGDDFWRDVDYGLITELPK